jgi:hypothetical protein
MNAPTQSHNSAAESFLVTFGPLVTGHEKLSPQEARWKICQAVGELLDGARQCGPETPFEAIAAIAGWHYGVGPDESCDLADAVVRYCNTEPKPELDYCREFRGLPRECPEELATLVNVPVPTPPIGGQPTGRKMTKKEYREERKRLNEALGGGQ